MTNTHSQQGSWRWLTAGIARLMEKAPPKVPHRIIGALYPRAEPLMRQIIAHCPADISFVDVGTWYGPWTYRVSKRVSEVHALEPNPRIAAALRRAVRRNVTVHDVAASSRSGAARLSLPVAGYGSEGTATLEPHDGAVEVMSVRTVRLDDLRLGAVGLIKIDVEGHELQVLRGAERLLSDCHPVIVVELDTRICSIDPTVRLLAEIGYSGKVWVDGEWVDFVDFDLPRWQAEHSDRAPRGLLREVVCGGRWINNVVWWHPSSRWCPWSTTR